MNTVPNQKTVIIHKKYPESNFMQISNEHWMEFNKKYGPFALQVYLYLAKNANTFHLALSQQAAENEAGIKRTTFHKYIDLLIKEGYLVWRDGNTYDFYETPRQPREKPSDDGKACAWDELEEPLYEFCSSPENQKFSSHNKEIDNIQKDNTTDIEKDKGTAREEGVETTSGTGKTEQSFVF